jgi:hypothetical protein
MVPGVGSDSLQGFVVSALTGLQGVMALGVGSDSLLMKLPGFNAGQFVSFLTCLIICFQFPKILFSF